MHGLADADFDMDLDTNFHEGESLFFNKLGYIKKDDDADADQEDSDEDKKPDKDKDANSDQDEEESKRKPGCDTLKPVAFLERPAAVRNAYRGFHDYSDEEEDEDKLLDTLLEETKDE